MATDAFADMRHKMEIVIPVVAAVAKENHGYVVGFLRGAGIGSGDEQLCGYHHYERGIQDGRAWRDW